MDSVNSYPSGYIRLTIDHKKTDFSDLNDAVFNSSSVKTTSSS